MASTSHAPSQPQSSMRQVFRESVKLCPEDEVGRILWGSSKRTVSTVLTPLRKTPLSIPNTIVIATISAFLARKPSMMSTLCLLIWSTQDNVLSSVVIRVFWDLWLIFEQWPLSYGWYLVPVTLVLADNVIHNIVTNSATWRRQSTILLVMLSHHLLLFRCYHMHSQHHKLIHNVYCSRNLQFNHTQWIVIEINVLTSRNKLIKEYLILKRLHMEYPTFSCQWRCPPSSFRWETLQFS